MPRIIRTLRGGPGRREEGQSTTVRIMVYAEARSPGAGRSRAGGLGRRKGGRSTTVGIMVYAEAPRSWEEPGR